MEEVCAAVQMAKRKGLPIAVILAGLPRSKELVASYSGCTFRQRVEDVRIGGLLVTDTVNAIRDLLGMVPILESSEEVIWALSEMSQGYPYLMQLVGYHFVQGVSEEYPVGVLRPTVRDVASVEEEVYVTYRRNVLVPSTKGLRAESYSYLRAMARHQDSEGFTRTANIARELGKQQKQLSSCRRSLIDRRLVLATSYGKLCFGLPYLTRFALERPTGEEQNLRGRWIPR